MVKVYKTRAEFQEKIALSNKHTDTIQIDDERN